MQRPPPIVQVNLLRLCALELWLHCLRLLGASLEGHITTTLAGPGKLAAVQASSGATSYSLECHSGEAESRILLSLV